MYKDGPMNALPCVPELLCDRRCGHNLVYRFPGPLINAVGRRTSHVTQGDSIHCWNKSVCLNDVFLDPCANVPCQRKSKSAFILKILLWWQTRQRNRKDTIDFCMNSMNRMPLISEIKAFAWKQFHALGLCAHTHHYYLFYFIHFADECQISTPQRKLFYLFIFHTYLHPQVC